MRASRSRCSRQCISESASVAERDSRQSGAKRAGDHRLGGPARGRASSPAEAHMKSGWTGCTVPAAICFLGLFAVLGIALPPGIAMAEEGGSGHYLPGSMASFIDGVPLSETFLMRANIIYYNGSVGPTKQLPIAGQTTLGAEASSFGPGPDGPLASAARPGRAVELCDERDDPVPLHGRGCGRHRRAGLDRVFRQHRRAGRHRPDAADAELQRRSGFQCELPRRLLCADRQLRGRPPRQHGQELLDHRTGPGAHVLRAEERHRGLRVPGHRLQHRERGYGLPVRHAAPPRRNVGAALPLARTGSRGEACPRTTTSR